MNVGSHEIAESLIHQAVTLKTREIGKPRSDDVYFEVAATVSCAGMSYVAMTVVDDLQRFGGKR